MEILFLTTVLPHARAAGGEIATQAVLGALRAAGHAVTVVGYRRAGDTRPVPPDWVEVGERAIETGAAGRAQTATWMAVALARRLPYSSTKFRSRRYAQAVAGLVRSRSFDLAVVDHAQMGWLRDKVQQGNLPFVLSAHNAEERLYAAQAEDARGLRRLVLRREASLIGALERTLTREGRGVWTIAVSDAAHFSGTGTVWTIPVPSSFGAPPPGTPKRCDVALIGTWTWDATRAALEWFLDEVYPRLPPELTVEVAGRGGDWIESRHPGVRYRGFVPDALEFLAAARVVAVPGVGATGVQIKTLDAIASGCQVVASPAALRDLSALPASVHPAATATEFADEVARLAASPDSRRTSPEGLDWTRRRREHFQASVARAAGAAAAR